MASLELSVLSTTDIKKEELQSLADSYKNLVVTRQNLTEVDRARKTLKQKRLEIQGTVKDNIKQVKDAIKYYEDEADKVLSIIQPIEIRLQTEQKVITDAIEAERRAAIEKEENRKRGIRNSISEIEFDTRTVRTSTNIEEIKLLEAKHFGKEDSFQEFNEEGNEVMAMFASAIESRLEHLKSIQKPKSDTNTTQGVKNVVVEEKQASATKVVEYAIKDEPKEPEMRYMKYKEYTFGYSSNIPLNLVSQINKAIKEIL